MKKISLFIFSILLSVVSMAAELNIYASGLQAGTPDASNKVQISYFLNAPATALEVQLKNGDAVVATFPITDAELLLKGSHVAIIDMGAVPSGIYTWAMKATAAPNAALTLVSQAESFFAARGVAVNYYPETPGFGNLYVSMCTSGTSNDIAKTKGIFVYNPALTCTNTSVTAGIVDASWDAAGAGSTAVGAPYRVSVGEDGNAYISCSLAPKGVWMLDGTSNSATGLHQVIAGGTPYGLCEVGTGENRVLYTLDGIGYASDACTGNLLKYPFGNTIPYTSEATTICSAVTTQTGNAHCSLASDGRGGFWIAQYRGSEGGLSILTHLNASGVKDYTSNSAGLGLSASTRGGMAVNADNSLVAVCTASGKVAVFAITYDGENVASLTKQYEVNSTGTNNDGIAFDYANNLYTITSSKEILCAYAPVKADNSCVTPAPTANSIQITNASNHVAWVLDGGYYFPYASKDAMYQDLAADVYASRSVCTGWGFATEFTGTFGEPNVTGTSGVALDIQTFDMTFLTTEPYATKWGWLKNYLDSQCSAQSKTLASSDQAFLRYNLAAFFSNSERANWPASANYLEAGKIENWIASFNNGETYPTTITTTYVIPAPCKPNHTFAGWYDNSGFTGEAITSLDATYDGNIYAKFTPIAVTGISLDKTNGTLPAGSTEPLVATVTPADALNKVVNWSTSDSDVATVSAGVVSAVGVGTATITATTADGGFTATYTVTVEAVNMSGEYKVGGTEADFATLYDACDLFSKANITGNVTFLICADLTEDKNIGLNNASAYSLTIRPDQDVDRTITLNQAADNVGPSGGLVIGGDQATNIGWGAIASSNITIDGYATAESTHKMKITTGGAFGVNAGPVIIYGNITNSMIKNCQLITGKTYVVTFRNEQTSTGTTNNAAQGFVFENCDIQTTSSAGQAIYFNGTKATTANTGAATNTIFRNCHISSKVRGMFLNGLNNLTIDGCTFNHAATSGNNSAVLFGNGSAGSIIIKNNKFLQNTTANTYSGGYGLTTIYASGGGTWYIDNNLFTGYDLTVSTSNNCIIKAIRCGSTCVIRHNTFIMDEFSHQPANTLLSENGAAIINVAAGTPTIQNNIFILKETASIASIIRGTFNANCTNNVFYKATGEGCKSVYFDGATPCADWDAVETAYGSYNNRNQEVTFTDNYKIANAYVDNINLAVPALPEITTDIEGNVRHSHAYAGCYEASDIAASIHPSAVLKIADGTAEAGWINFGSKVLGAGDYADSKEYKLVVTDIDMPSVTLSIEDITGFTVSAKPDANGNFTVEYEVPAATAQAYKGYLVVDGNDVLGDAISSIKFQISLDVNAEGIATSIEDVNNAVNIQKVIRDGKVYIIRNGVTYTTTGQVVK